MAASVCAQRVPTSSMAWSDASRQWHEDHHEKLLALGKAQEALVKAMESQDAPGAPLHMPEFVAHRAQAVSLVLYALAMADDAHAARSCDNLRAEFLNSPDQNHSMDETLAASTTVLAAFGRH